MTFVFISKGSPSEMNKVALLPDSKVPYWLSIPKILAVFSVINCKACSFESPQAAQVPA